MNVSRRALMWWLLSALLIAAWLAWQQWQNRAVAIALPVVNRTHEPAALEFHGSGLVESVRTTVAPGAEHLLHLTVANAGEVRLRIATSRVQNDSLLLDNARYLQQAQYRFEIRPHSEFVLVQQE